MPDLLPFLGFTTAVFLIVFLGRWLVGGTLERRFVRKHGFSKDNPACAQCHYLSEGWTSPVCPECGADARDTGLRVGPRAKAIRTDGLLVAILVAYIIPCAILGARWIAHGETVDANLTITCDQLKSVVITLRQTTTETRFPEYSETTSSITIHNNATLQTSPPITIATTDDLTDDELRNALLNVAQVPQENVDAQLNDIADVLTNALFDDGALRSDLSPSTDQIQSPYSITGGGYSFTPLKRTPLAIGATVIVTLILGLLLIRAIVRTITDGFAYPATDDDPPQID